MNIKRSPNWLLSILALVVVLTACGGERNTWPGIAGSTDGDTVLVSYRKTVTSLAPDKDRNWTYRGENDTDFYAPAVIADGRAYVGDYKGRIHAINLEDGKRVWMYEAERRKFLWFSVGAIDRVIGPIGLGEGMLFFGTEHGVSALDITEDDHPTLLWDFKTGHSVWSQPLYLNNANLGISPTLYVTSLDKHLYALDPETGQERWSLDMGGGMPGGMTLDIGHRRLYVGTLNGEVVAVSLEGQELARFKADGWVWGQPALHNGYLYFGDLSGMLYEVEITDAGFGQSAKRKLSDKALRATPLIVEDDEGQAVLVIGSDDKQVYAINLSQPNWISDNDIALRWKKGVDAQAVTELTLMERDGKQLVIVGTENKDHLVVALRLNDKGEREWSYKYEK